MWPMRSYQRFRAGGDEAHSGMMNRPSELPRPFWTFCIQVDGAGSAAGRAVAAGGKVLMGPQQTPTGEWIVQGLDSQGALFCLLSLKP